MKSTDVMSLETNVPTPASNASAPSVASATKDVLLGKTLEECQALVKELGQPSFRAKQLTEWLYDKRVSTIDEMTNLPKAMRQQLNDRFIVGRSEPIDRQISKDGTEKYLFAVLGRPELSIETVYIPEGDRATLCISSQVGCRMNCSFCQTGRMGFRAQLKAADIINQVLSVPFSDKLTNIVYMGMGEPLDNYEQVAKTLSILTEGWGMAWSPKRITVSTIGPKKGLQRFLEEQKVHLAISIHSPYSEERLSLMPVEKAFPIMEVIDTLTQYDFSGQRRLSFEYILFDGLNDSITHARQLVRILKPLDCRVNLIRYHAIPDVPYHAPQQDRVEAFEQFLNHYNVRCTVRRSRGEDIFAACGMLSTKDEESRCRKSYS